jgi:hypothetical protein
MATKKSTGKVIKLNSNLQEIITILKKYNKKNECNFQISNDCILVKDREDWEQVYLFVGPSTEPLSYTCTMDELSLDEELNIFDYLTNDLKDYFSIKLSNQDKSKIFILLLKEALTSKYLQNNNYKKDQLITNVVKNSNNHKIITKTAMFRKIYEYQGSDGIIFTYVLKNN